MTPQDYLQQLLTDSSHYHLSVDEKKILEKNGLEKFIFAKLTSKKFRKVKMDPDCVTRTRHAISTKVKKNESIDVVYPQGGYKLWRFPSSPTVDWAEFFNISYVLQYIAPLAEVYKPGVHLTYYMHTLLMELHDNLTTKEIQAYVDSFESLLNDFRKYLPSNITISILRDADLYTRDEYFVALENGVEPARKEYEKFSREKKEAMAKMSMLNIKWDGKENWNVLSEKEKQDKVTMAGLYEMSATSQLERVFEKVKSPENVLVFTKGTPDFIGIGSTKASIAKYWVGFGVLQRKGDSFLSVILSPSQYLKALKLAYKKEKVEVINQKNFQEVMVFDRQLFF